MEKKSEQIHADQWLKDVSADEAGIQGFKPEEMIACPRCQRKSPPTRLKCFYCGAELPVSAEQAEFIRPQPRRMESWEKAFNLILLPNAQQTCDDAALREVAAMTRLETEDLRKLIEAQKPLPLARADSEREAEIIAKRLSEINFESLVLSDDEDLKIEIVTRRLRRIEFYEDKLVLILFNSDEIAEIRREDLSLIVTGAMFERRIEASGQRKKRENQIRETTETSADELLIDIYGKDDSIGCRIISGGFDFSCLGAEKAMLARENMRKLVEKLRAFAPPGAKFVGDYLQVRDVLGKVWEVEEKQDSRGLQRKGFGRFDFGSVTTINNLNQFTKYSRLQRHLI
ncbi:MAG: hypothetical protein M3384_13110 [Acidobacteriota bacterium]|nr:hypothetical protein [Acidobacteriota bacterium]